MTGNMLVELPMAREPERVVIGGCLSCGTQCTLEVFGLIQPEDFHDDSLAGLARALIKAAQTGYPTDPASLQLKWQEVGQGAPPLKLLGELPELCPTQEVALLAAGEVLKAARRRKLILAAAQATEALQDPSKSDSEALAPVLSAQVGHADVECLTPAELAQVLLDETQRRYDTRGQLQGIASGFHRLDAMTDGLQRGELTVLGARPSQGKSALALCIAAHAVFTLKIPTLFVSLEMSAYALARRMAACVGQVGLGGMRSGEMPQDDFNRFGKFCTLLKQSCFHIAYAPGIDSTKLAMLIRQYVGQHKVEMVVVDYLQMIRAVGRHEKRTYEVGSVSGSLKASAVRNNVAVVAPCQLSRGPEQDGNRAPRMSDLADSSQIERDTDLLLLVHFPDRAAEPERAKLIVAKQRDGECGAIDVRWNPGFVRFENPRVEA